MPCGSHSIQIKAPTRTVFDLIHNYGRRLEWDPMLSEARLLGDATVVTLGARSRCVGNWKCFWLPIEATYIAFESGKVATVSMDNRTLFFGEFNATIRHNELDDAHSEVTYVYQFKSKPRWLAFLFEPIMNSTLKREVKHRLKFLKAFVEQQ